MLSKEQERSDREFNSIYFNSAAKSVIKINKYGTEKSFQQVLYRLVNWIIEEAAWKIEYIDGKYINISIYSLYQEIHILNYLMNQNIQ